MISADFLRQYSFFASLSDKHLSDIASIAAEKTFPAATILFNENTAANNLMLLLEGGVEMFYSGGAKGTIANTKVCSIATGAIFGISSLIKPYQYTASARAIMPVKVVDIDGAVLRRMAEDDQMLGRVLMNNVAAAVLARLH